jgi:hypothetical protein
VLGLISTSDLVLLHTEDEAESGMWLLKITQPISPKG